MPNTRRPVSPRARSILTLFVTASSLLLACSGSQPQAESPAANPTQTDSNSSDSNSSDSNSSDSNSSDSNSGNEPSSSDGAASEGSEPCKATQFEFEQVRAACEDGGVMAAKQLMKDVVKRAKDSGKSLKCASCHDNTKTYSLAENAVADLRALLEN